MKAPRPDAALGRCVFPAGDGSDLCNLPNARYSAPESEAILVLEAQFQEEN